MSGTDYRDVLTQAEQLNVADQLRLLERMASVVRRRAERGARRSILELRGKGKHVWGDIDAQEYVDQERASWSG